MFRVYRTPSTLRNNKKPTAMKKKNNPAMSASSPSGGVEGALQTIDQMISEDLLYLDPIKPAVVVSWQLHLAVMDDEYKASRWPWRWLIRHGWVERDKRYRRLMKAIKIYLELPRGTMQGQYEVRLVTQGMDRAEAHREAVHKYPIHEGPLHFIVSDPEDPSQPLLLGTYDQDRIALKEASPNPLPKRGLTDIAEEEDDSIGPLESIDNLDNPENP